MMELLPESDSTIILEFIYGKKVIKIDLMLKKKTCKSHQNGHFSKFCQRVNKGKLQKWISFWVNLKSPNS